MLLTQFYRFIKFYKLVQTVQRLFCFLLVPLYVIIRYNHNAFFNGFVANQPEGLLTMGAGASVGLGDGDDSGPISCGLRGLPEALETAVFVREKWPVVVDPSGQAGRYLRYQRGSFLLADSPADMEPEHLRTLLVRAFELFGARYTRRGRRAC